MEDKVLDSPPRESFRRPPPTTSGLFARQVAPVSCHRRFSIRTAGSAKDRYSAAVLVDRMYATRGYQTTGLPDQDSPSRKTFLASDSRQDVGTMTIRLDSPAGLLAEQLFPDEVAAFRDAGLGVCEVTKLAMDSRARSPRLLASLFHVAHIFSHRLHALERLVIEVNPRHVKYYEAMLGFKVISDVRHNQRVNAPAVLLSMDLNWGKKQIEAYGGRPELAAGNRSALPYFFSARDEAEMALRILRPGEEIAHVYDLRAAQEHLENNQDSHATH